MKPSDRKPFLEIVIGFAELKGKTLSAPALELYWNAMQTWELSDFQIAANRLLLTCPFMPTPKDFEDLRKAGRETAGEVFAEIRQWLRYSPNGYTLQPDTPRNIETAIRAMGGPNAYANCQVNKLPFLERRFCEHLETLQDVTGTRAALPQLDVKGIARSSLPSESSAIDSIESAAKSEDPC
jgi:hypothetical protein